MKVLSVLIAILIVGGTAAMSYTVMDMVVNWRMLSTMSPWQPALVACASAAAFTLAWALQLVRDRAASQD